MWHVWGREEVHIAFLWGNPRERGHLEDPNADGRKILRWIFKKCDRAWTELIWLRIGICG